MLKSIEGVYRYGKIELLEPGADAEDARVVVTFLPSPSSVNLSERNLDSSQAAELRARLRSFAEDWDRPEMDVYDEM